MFLTIFLFFFGRSPNMSKNGDGTISSKKKKIHLTVEIFAIGNANALLTSFVSFISTKLYWEVRFWERSHSC